MNFIQKFKARIRAKNSSIEEWEKLSDFLGINAKSRKELNELTYYTCQKILAETMGKLPIKHYKLTEEGKIRADPNEAERLLTIRPNSYMTPTNLFTAAEYNVNQYGNAYIWLQNHFEKAGKYGGKFVLDGLWLMPSQDVSILLDNNKTFGEKDAIYYRYTDNGEEHIFPSRDVMHFKTWLSLDGIRGEPVREILKYSIDGMLDSQEFSNNLYKNGMTARMSLEYPGELDDALVIKLRKKLERYTSGVNNAGRVVPVPIGFKLTPLNVSLVDAQFFELKKLSALQIAAAFGIKPNQINNYEKSSYSNSEMQQLAFLTETMGYKLKGYEEEINYKLSRYIGENEYFKFNEKAILRVDSKTQADIINTFIQCGVYNVNIAKDILDLPKVEGGDVTMVNGTFLPLTEIGNQYKKE